MSALEPAAEASLGGPTRHPFLLTLAERLLTKAERVASEGSNSRRGVRLRLDHNVAPQLYGHVDAELLRRWELLLQELCDTGWVRLVLAPAREFASWLDRRPQLELLDFDALARWAGFQRQEDRWNRQLVACLRDGWHQTSGDAKRELLDYLLRNPMPALAELPAADAMGCLAALQSICACGASMPLRELSARVFQGRSKVLDSRGELLRLLGASAGQFREAPIQLLVDAPAAFDNALFIENLVTFEEMADQRRPGWAHSVLVYAAGFRGGAKRLRMRQGCRVYVRMPVTDPVPPGLSAGDAVETVNAWLFGSMVLPVRFFGDLDFAGMQILAGLREVFADAQAWRPGYGELLEQLASGGGHPPQTASKEGQIDPGMTGCPYADGELLPSMRLHGRFVDQECFGVGS